MKLCSSSFGIPTLGLILTLLELIAGINAAKGNYSYEAQQSRSPSLATSSKSASHIEPVYTKASDEHGPAQRSGIGIDKGPPDLQFGLAFTVPFVSLSTEKLLHQVSGNHGGYRGYNSLSDIMSVLKLNVGGLILAAVVGLAALLFVPAIFKGNVPSIFHGGGGGGGYGPSGFGGFMPGFLENIMPGLGLTKPLGYGQGPSYDQNTYPYGNDNYGAYSQRKDKEGKGRSLYGDKPGQHGNGTKTSFWGDLLKTVQSTVIQAENCAAYAMCERGRESVRNRTRSSTGASGRGGRKLEDSPTNANSLSSFDHVLEAIHGVGGEKLPGLSTLQKAYTTGASGLECAKHYTKCPVTPTQLDGIMRDVGNYIFT